MAVIRFVCRIIAMAIWSCMVAFCGAVVGSVAAWVLEEEGVLDELLESRIRDRRRSFNTYYKYEDD